VRAVLDEAGLAETRLLGSGDLDEYKIRDLLAEGAPFDAFGVGTSLGVGAGSLEHDVEGGALGGVYKLVAYVDAQGETVPKVKLAGDKTTLPGAKEVYRVGAYAEDVVQLADEPRPSPDADRLLKPVLRGGGPLPGAMPPLSEIWELASRNLERMPSVYRQLDQPATYPVRYSDALLDLARRARNREQGGPS
jgi:nicotinate phosphoribosyltransferase